MRKTIKSLEYRIEQLERTRQAEVNYINLLEEQIRFYKNNTQLIVTATISLEKITDVVAHVVSDMKSLRDNPNKERR